MLTTPRCNRRIRFHHLLAAVVCLLVLPATGQAGLQQMAETELKAVYCNDFKRPSQNPRILGPDQKGPTGFDHQAEPVPVTAQATRITFDTEGFTRDLEAQYKNIQAGGQATLPNFSSYAKIN